LRKRWRRSLGGIALLYALGQIPPALAAPIDVGGACTLVDAITAANADQVAGGCAAGSGVDTITLPAGRGRPAYRPSPPRSSSTATAAPSHAIHKRPSFASSPWTRRAI